MSEDEPWVPRVLRIGRKGVLVKIWTFLYLNQNRWFTSQDISDYLEMPLTTVQLSVKDLWVLAPRILCRDREIVGRGRPQKEYSFQKTSPVTTS